MLHINIDFNSLEVHSSRILAGTLPSCSASLVSHRWYIPRRINRNDAESGDKEYIINVKNNKNNKSIHTRRLIRHSVPAICVKESIGACPVVKRSCRNHVHGDNGTNYYLLIY